MLSLFANKPCDIGTNRRSFLLLSIYLLSFKLQVQKPWQWQSICLAYFPPKIVEKSRAQLETLQSFNLSKAATAECPPFSSLCFFL